MTLVFYSLTDQAERWRKALCTELPALRFVLPAEAEAEPAAVDYALVWRPPPAWLRQFPNLRAVFSLGAGVDHLLGPGQDLPPGLPIVRLVDPALTQRMVEYVTLHVLRHHRRHERLARAQRERQWRPLYTPLASERRVGILGLGALGVAVARALQGLGFAVSGWARSPKPELGIPCATGSAGLRALAEGSDILVCLLPLTDATRGILNAALFAALPRGACLINAGRGGHLVEGDLLAALRAGQIAEATLDVFETEPLPPDHWAWDEPGVCVTAHTASLTDTRSAARTVAANLLRLEAGGALRDLVDLERGY